MGREDNAREFRDTEQKYTTDPDLARAVRDSVSRQSIIHCDDPLKDISRRFDCTEVIVNRQRSFQAARGIQGKACALNFASFTHPGGNVAGGSDAQEESLCRISTLYPCLADERIMDGFYRRHRGFPSRLFNSDIVYTPGVMIFKTDAPNPITLSRQSWYEADVITCAAPDLRDIKVSDDELYAIHRERIGRIFNAAMSNDADVLILGAFGCGVFRNDPAIVAEAFRDVLKEYNGCFREAVFAIYSKDGDANYSAFSKVLSS